MLNTTLPENYTTPFPISGKNQNSFDLSFYELRPTNTRAKVTNAPCRTKEQLLSFKENFEMLHPDIQFGTGYQGFQADKNDYYLTTPFHELRSIFYAAWSAQVRAEIALFELSQLDQSKPNYHHLDQIKITAWACYDASRKIKDVTETLITSRGIWESYELYFSEKWSDLYDTYLRSKQWKTRIANKNAQLLKMGVDA